MLLVLMHFLPTMLAAQAIFTPDKTVWNFGVIQEAKGKVYHVYTYTNTGNKPLVINEVISSCGCAVAEYPKYPLEPNEKAELKVLFDPHGRTSRVNKSLKIVYNSGKSICNLFIKGFIEIEINPTEDFQYELMDGMRSERLFLYGGSIKKGAKKVVSVSIYNTSNKTKKLSHRIVGRNHGITVKRPSVIKPKSLVKIDITIDADKITEKKLSDSLLLIFDEKEAPKAIKLAASIIMK